jgi:signal transduction histidine kinase
LQLQQKKNELQKADIQNKYFSGISLLFLMVSILLFILYKQYRKQKDKEIISLKREQQVKTLESLILGEEKERFRIAKELHDGVNGDLSAIKYKLTSLLEKNNIVINEAVEMIDKSCEHVRAISHNLIPPSLEKFNLIEAVDDYCASANDIHEPEITFQHIGKEVNIPKKVEVNIFRIIQEIITNSIKHAKATEINVQVSNQNNNLQITIEDNGVGFNKDKVSGDGIGLKNIQSRVDYLNASLDLVSNNKGTSYTIEIDTSKLNDN